MDMTDYHSYILKRVQQENINDSVSPTMNYYSQLSVCVCVCARAKSCLTLCSLVYCIVTCQFPLFMEFSRQEYWSGLPFHTLGDLPDSGMEPTSPVWQVDSLPLCHLGKWWKWKLLSHVQLFAAPMDYRIHGILQARILEWTAVPFSRGSSQPRDRTQVSHIAGRFSTSWAIREAQE